MTHQSSVKGIPYNFRNVPFLSHLTPGKALLPQGLYPYPVFSSPQYKLSGDLLTPSLPRDPRALVSSPPLTERDSAPAAALPVAPGRSQLLRCSWQALRLRGMRAFLWLHVRSQCDYSTAADILSLSI